MLNIENKPVNPDGLKRVNVIENNNKNLVTSAAVKASKIWKELTRTSLNDVVIDLQESLANYDELLVTINKSNGRVEGSTLATTTTFYGGGMYVIGMDTLNGSISSYGVAVWLSNTKIQLAGTYSQMRFYAR